MGRNIRFRTTVDGIRARLCEDRLRRGQEVTVGAGALRKIIFPYNPPRALGPSLREGRLR